MVRQVRGYILHAGLEALFWPAFEAIRLWLVAVPVLAALIAVLGIGAWVGWTMATTPPQKPIEEIASETEAEEEKEEKAKAEEN